MQRDYVARGLKVKQVAVFYLSEFYKTMFRWFESNHYDFQEKEYRESVDPTKGKHLEIRWYAEKKIDDYVKFVIEIEYLILGLQDIVVEKEGVKTKTNKGSLELRFHAYLLKDYEDKWSKTAFIQFLRAVYDKYLIRARMEAFEQRLLEELRDVIAEAKSFLALHKF